MTFRGSLSVRDVPSATFYSTRPQTLSIDLRTSNSFKGWGRTHCIWGKNIWSPFSPSIRAHLYFPVDIGLVQTPHNWECNQLTRKTWIRILLHCVLKRWAATDNVICTSLFFYRALKLPRGASVYIVHSPLQLFADFLSDIHSQFELETKVLDILLPNL